VTLAIFNDGKAGRELVAATKRSRWPGRSLRKDAGSLQAARTNSTRLCVSTKPSWTLYENHHIFSIAGSCWPEHRKGRDCSLAAIRYLARCHCQAFSFLFSQLSLSVPVGEKRDLRRLRRLRRSGTCLFSLVASQAGASGA